MQDVTAVTAAAQAAAYTAVMKQTDIPRALRRHQSERIKAKRKVYHTGPRPGQDSRDQARRLGMVAHTAKPCSCWMCGNARRHNGPTIQERRHFQIAAC